MYCSCSTREKVRASEPLKRTQSRQGLHHKLQRAFSTIHTLRSSARIFPLLLDSAYLTRIPSSSVPPPPLGSVGLGTLYSRIEGTLSDTLVPAWNVFPGTRAQQSQMKQKIRCKLCAEQSSANNFSGSEEVKGSLRRLQRLQMLKPRYGTEMNRETERPGSNAKPAKSES